MCEETLLRRTFSCSVRDVFRLTFGSPGRRWAEHIWVPDFQRPYVWTVSDIQKLLDDVDELRGNTGAPMGITLYRFNVEYYLGSICIRKKEKSYDFEILDGQQRLTSILVLLTVLYDRALKIRNNGIVTSLVNWINSNDLLGKNASQWRKLLIYSDPRSFRQIQIVRNELDRNYKILEADSKENNCSEEMPYYERIICRDLYRLIYILKCCKLAVIRLETLKESEQFFQGENNRGLPMELLDILKAYHMRFETNRDRLKQIHEIWTKFNSEWHDNADSQEKYEAETSDNECREARRWIIENLVLPALLMRLNVEPWNYTALDVKNADKLKGILGTHTRDRAIDYKLARFIEDQNNNLATEINKNGAIVYDLLDPVRPGLPFFQAVDQYLRIAEAILLLLNSAPAGLKPVNDNERVLNFEPLDLDVLQYFNDDQHLIFRLALIAWADRFLPIALVKDGLKSSREIAKALSEDVEFQSYARTFARFLGRFRNTNDHKGIYDRLDKVALLKAVHFYDIGSNYLFMPHRSSSPSACRRELMRVAHPDNYSGPWREQYREAYEAEIQ